MDSFTTHDTGSPTTPGAFRCTLVGQIDAFVAKLNRPALVSNSSDSLFTKKRGIGTILNDD